MVGTTIIQIKIAKQMIKSIVKKYAQTVGVNRPRTKVMVDMFNSGLLYRLIMFFLNKYNMIKIDLKYKRCITLNISTAQ